MKAYLSKSLILSVMTVGFLSTGWVGISQALEDSTTTHTMTPEGVAVTTTIIHQSDSPYVGDPMGNGPVTARANAGPALTRRPYTEGCREDRCLRAQKRQLSSTTWQQDRASGLSKGFGAGE